MVSTAKPTARKTRLKVFRTAIGFHDAYVAAPSRKAALAAWGTDKDLFARGIAEEVMDPALIEKPLSAPGTVFRQLRSMLAEEPQEKRRKKGSSKAPEGAAPKNSMQPVPLPPPPPRPNDRIVADAERALEAAREQHAEEQRDLAARERELEKDRHAMEARHARDERLLHSTLEAARKEYQTQLQAWHEAVAHDHGR